MTDDGLELTRRKILASTGAVGLAGAGLGLGTSAFFSDDEQFANNQLVAGELDLKVSWDEHYSDWMGDETQYASMPEEGEEPDLSLPAPEDMEGGKDIELVFSDQGEFMDATRQEQFPEGGLGDADPCEALADVPGDLEAPVIDLEDVKPGDFGEVTFDFASCDNPAYLWMNGELIDEAENGVTEPEADDPQEDQNEDGSLKEGEEGPAEVELADKLQARAWYDDNGASGGGGNTVSTSATWSFTDLSDPGLDAEGLAETLVSDQSGVTVSNVSYTGADAAAGTFSGGGPAVGIDEGIILSSGNIADVAGPNDATGETTIFDNPGDPDLDALVPQSTEDAAVLEFDFTVPEDAEQVFFNYVFGSEEYDEWVDSSFNDVFGFFLNPDSGTPEETNIALIEDPDNPDEDAVSINNINNGENSDLYLDNRDGDDQDPNPDTDVDRDTQMDGFTVVLDVGPDVEGGSTNTLKLAIADAGDAQLDSWVLLEGGSLTTDPDPEGEPGDNIHQDNEQIFAEGSLREVLEALSDGPGVPLSGNIPAEEGGGTGRNCYSAAPDVHYVAFQWWLPIDHGNEVQSDSVTFDLGFYAEQCRHNDGSGMEVGNEA